MFGIFEQIGRYFILMGKVFSRPEKGAIYRRRIIYEMESLGIDSIGLTAIISIFIGAVITLQMCINLDSPFIPQSLIGYATRETMILEFSSTVVALILSGKVGSSIASEIGTMRITEQIDALEIMGVNSASYLILPKIVAAVFFFPFLTILSIAIGIIGGWLIAYLTGIMIPNNYIEGLLLDFRPYSITYSLIKTAVFAYIITSISSYFGYYAKGNSLEVGKASTRAVVVGSVVIMIFNLILTQILLI
ncbi:MAG: ABC transporter permease [Rikenellaceae bacterium]|nr:ABC transporter permease [Rikenellaceae bacterium]